MKGHTYPLRIDLLLHIYPKRNYIETAPARFAANTGYTIYSYCKDWIINITFLVFYFDHIASKKVSFRRNDSSILSFGEFGTCNRITNAVPYPAIECHHIVEVIVLLQPKQAHCLTPLIRLSKWKLCTLNCTYVLLNCRCMENTQL